MNIATNNGERRIPTNQRRNQANVNEFQVLDSFIIVFLKGKRAMKTTKKKKRFVIIFELLFKEDS